MEGKKLPVLGSDPDVARISQPPGSHWKVCVLWSPQFSVVSMKKGRLDTVRQLSYF